MEIIVVLDNIRSGFNVGNILRTTEFLGIKKIIALGITPLPPHKEVIKTSLGAENNLEFERRYRLKSLIEELKKEKYKIIAIEQSKNSIPYYKFTKKFKKIALIVGNEIKGINKKHLQLCDYILEVPKKGKIKESLNVGIAFAIVLSHLVFHSKSS